MIKKALLLIALFFWSTVFALTPKDQKWRIIDQNAPDSTVTSSIEWFTPFSLDEAPTNIEYRISLIPNINDRDSDVFLVVPTLGLTAPVNRIPSGSQDFTDMVSGKLIDLNKYLVDWPTYYANSVSPWENGKMFITWLSNHFENVESDYKTVFADIMSLDAWVDEIRFFSREKINDYALHKYDIIASNEVGLKDVDILTRKWWSEVMLYTSFFDKRWVVEWINKIAPEKEDLNIYGNLSQALMSRVDKAIGDIKNENSGEQLKFIIVDIIKLIVKIRDQYNLKSATLVSDYTSLSEKELLLQYIEDELVSIYPV